MCNIPHCCLPQESGPCLSPNVAGRPLRPATDRRLGGPLPRQQANQTRAHPVPPEFSARNHAVPCAYAVLAAVSGCCPPVRGRLPTRYSPVRHSVIYTSSPKEFRVNASFDLHVLSTPPAFILSQDQTLMLKCLSGQNQAWLISPILHCFKGVTLSYIRSGYRSQTRNYLQTFVSELPVKEILLKFFYESFKVISLFSYQGSYFAVL